MGRDFLWAPLVGVMSKRMAELRRQLDLDDAADGGANGLAQLQVECDDTRARALAASSATAGAKAEDAAGGGVGDGRAKRRRTTTAYQRSGPGDHPEVVRDFWSPSGRTGVELRTTTPGGQNLVFHEEVPTDAVSATKAKAEKFNNQRDKNARKKAKKDGGKQAAGPVTSSE